MVMILSKKMILILYDNDIKIIIITTDNVQYRSDPNFRA